MTRIFLTVGFSVSTVDSPVVITVIVYSAFAIEEKTVFAGFNSECSIGAEEEQIAGFRMGVGLDSVLFRTGWGVSD